MNEAASCGSSLETKEVTSGSGRGRGPGPADGGSGSAGTTLDTSVSKTASGPTELTTVRIGAMAISAGAMFSPCRFPHEIDKVLPTEGVSPRCAVQGKISASSSVQRVQVNK